MGHDVLRQKWPSNRHDRRDKGCATGALQLVRPNAGRRLRPPVSRGVAVEDDPTRDEPRYINDNIDRIRRLFKWAVAHELIPVTVHQALTAVPDLRRGRTAARENEPVMPVSDAVIEATIPFLRTVVADMVRLQRLRGCRPDEVCWQVPNPNASFD